MDILKRSFKILWDMVESTTFALGFVMVTYLFLFQTGEVHGASSYPTWKENDKFITDKVSYRFSMPQRGDFIVLQSPQNPDVDFIKRIVGLPNEVIKFSDCQVYINGSILTEPYIKPDICTRSDNKDVKIPASYYYVMGDNRENSSDSRVFGPIPQSSIVGKVILRFWPLEKFGQSF